MYFTDKSDRCFKAHTYYGGLGNTNVCWDCITIVNSTPCRMMKFQNHYDSEAQIVEPCRSFHTCLERVM